MIGVEDINSKDFSTLIGKIIRVITIAESNDEILFILDDGSEYILYHDQDCCENVCIEEIIGDLGDLINTPILDASEETSKSIPDPDEDDSVTWTFYKLSTIKGSVTIRWVGSSNGYYSESVDFGKVSYE